MATTTIFPVTTSEPQVQVTLGVGTHELELVVEDSAGNQSVAAPVTVTVVGLPFITGICPTTGGTGTSVTITGRNFINVTKVRFGVDDNGTGGVDATDVAINSPHSITANVPENAGTGYIQVVTQYDEALSDTQFIIKEEISVDIVPQTARVFDGQTQIFTASVTGSDNTAVDWEVEAGGGSITPLEDDPSKARYTAPATAGTYHVIATSQDDTSRQATAEVTVEVVIISIEPTSASVEPGGRVQFRAIVSGTDNDKVVWTAKRGEISIEGLYTAPNQTGKDIVTVASIADHSKSASSKVEVKGVHPTAHPTTHPTLMPTTHPTVSPTAAPTISPTHQPRRSITEVNGIGPTYESRLKNAGVVSLDQLAGLDAARLAEILGITEVRAMGFIATAKDLLAP